MRKQRVNYSTQRLIQRSRVIIVKCRIWLQITLQLTTKKKTCATIYFENLTRRHKVWVNFDFLLAITHCVTFVNASKYQCIMLINTHHCTLNDPTATSYFKYYRKIIIGSVLTELDGLWAQGCMIWLQLQHLWCRTRETSQPPGDEKKKRIYNIQLEKKIKKMNGQNW